VSAAPAFALLGLGEAGTAIAADLVAAGATVRGWDPVREPPPGVVAAGDEREAVRDAAIVLSLNSAAVAVEAAAAAAPGLRADAVYADLNTAAPAVKRAAAKAAGAAFADVALLGPVPGNGVRTPALASGPGAERFAAALRALGMPVTHLGPEVGEASARKLARSVFAKGLAAAVGESLEAARRLGCEDWLHAELEAALTAADDRYLTRLIEGSLTHSRRRAEEMAAAVALLEELGVEPRVAAASEAWLRSLGHSGVGR